MGKKVEDTDKVKLEVYRRHHNRRDEKGKMQRINPGETFNGTGKELRAFSDRLKLANEKPAKNPEPKKDEEFEALKARADELGVKYPKNIGKEALQDKVSKTEADLKGNNGGTE